LRRAKEHRGGIARGGCAGQRRTHGRVSAACGGHNDQQCPLPHGRLQTSLNANVMAALRGINGRSPPESKPD
jgi:hypothetical protein